MSSNLQAESLHAQCAVTVTSILWGAAYVVIHFSAGYFSPGSMAALRFLSASVAMLFLYFMRTRHNTIAWRDLPSIALLSFLGLVLYNLALNRGEQVIDGGTTSLIKMTSPIIAALLATMIHKERITKWVGAALVLGFVGATLIAANDMGSYELRIGLLFIFIAMFCGLLFTVLQKKIVMRVDPIQFFACAVWCATFFTIFWWPSMWRDVAHAPLRITAWIVFNGVVPAAIGYSLWSYGLSKLPVNRVVVFLYLTPVSSIMIEWIVLNIKPSGLAFIGGTLILGSLMIVNREKTV